MIRVRSVSAATVAHLIRADADIVAAGLDAVDIRHSDECDSSSVPNRQSPKVARSLTQVTDDVESASGDFSSRDALAGPCHRPLEALGIEGLDETVGGGDIERANGS